MIIWQFTLNIVVSWIVGEITAEVVLWRAAAVGIMMGARR